jgi:hypothetical protein
LNVFANDIADALHLPDLQQAARIAVHVQINGAAFVSRGNAAETERVYTALNQKMCNVVRKKISSFEEMYSDDEDDQLDEDDDVGDEEVDG